MKAFGKNSIFKLIGFVVFVFAAASVLSSCSPDNGTEADTFDRKAMLQSVAENLIIPNFELLQASVSDLSVKTDDFSQNPTEFNLLALRESWKKAVVDHQHCSAFGFGPANLLLGPYGLVLGVFPVSKSKIEANISNPDFDLENSFDIDVRGFYAIEYLIFGKGDNGQVISSFNQSRKDYLKLLVAELKTTFDNVVNEWNSSYKTEFINSDGTSAGSSITLYYNGFIKDYENLKNYKVELPAGLTAGQNAPDSTLVEAYYSGISTELIAQHFESAKNIWAGKSRTDEDVIGFDEYLETVVGGPELVAETKKALLQIDQAIDNLPEGRLSQHVNGEEIIILRDQLQNNTANFKSSMVSLLGLTITYNSGDGD